MEFYPKYGITNEQASLIVSASALHDIGKIAIPDSILLKPGRLTPEEFEEMKKHTIYGCEILEKFKQEENEFYRYCYDICRYHHERYDGGGYPDKLKGDEIPIWAQIVSIVDVFDALVSKRVYKAPYAVEEAERMIMRGECGVFSPEILDCFQIAKPELRAATEVEFSFADALV
jgi:putative two-component system response regulator